MRTMTKRAIATAAAAAIAVTTFSLQPAAAGFRHGGDAAAAAAFAAVFGTIAAIIAAEQYRDQPVYGPSYGPPCPSGPGYRRPRPYEPWRNPRHWLRGRRPTPPFGASPSACWRRLVVFCSQSLTHCRLVRGYCVRPE